ncbi:MAG TPA: NAD(P)/FAD-dependent oxidoreductase [bacterium]|nr:NAD(P)/FAD-dependent oxidoreductase [bacterium]
MRTLFDCAVVGGGPAGAAAALTLARRGRRVILLEKEPLPRSKPCGGGMPPSVLSLLALPSIDGIVDRVHRLTFLYDGGSPVSHELAEPLLMVDRARFDHFLVRTAGAAGAEVRDRTAVRSFGATGDHWEIGTSAGTFAARKIILTDGGQGRCAALAGFPPNRRTEGLALACELPADRRRDELTVDLGLLPCGYLWIFPKGDRISLGVGITKRGGNHLQLFDKMAVFAGRQGLPFDRSLCRGHRVAIWDGARPLTRLDSFLLAGEAAFLADPLSAEGIRPAVKSGIAAGEAVDASLGGDATAFSRYEERMRRELGREFAIAARIAKFFFLFPSLSYRAAFFHPRTTAIMNEVFLGRVAYSDLAGKVLSTLARTVKRRPL